MARTQNRLTDTTIRTAKPAGDTTIRKLSDGGGLQLWIMPGGSKLWRLDYRHGGKRKLLALGSYPLLSLQAAREKAREEREALARGEDPSSRKKLKKLAAIAAVDNTFGALAAKLLEKKRREGRAPATLAKMQWVFDKVADQLGQRPIADISTPDIVVVLRKEEDAGLLETARRVRTVVGEVFRFSMQHGIIASDPVQATRGLLARPSARHHSAIIEADAFAHLLRKIDTYAEKNVLTGSALQLMALLFPRPGELRQADWSEFDLEKQIWTVPASRMKMKRLHTKPLSRQAIEILTKLHAISGPRGFLFPAVGKRSRPMSENTMNDALERMGVPKDQHVPHGFRSSASTLLNDSNLFSADAVERELAHQDTDSIRRAYRRGDLMAERIKMAQWWADYLDQLRAIDLRTPCTRTDKSNNENSAC